MITTPVDKQIGALQQTTIYERKYIKVITFKIYLQHKETVSLNFRIIKLYFLFPYLMISKNLLNILDNFDCLSYIDRILYQNKASTIF